MTADEAEALFLSGLPGPAAELGLGTVVAAARLKVLAALPTELRARASRLVERFHLDAAAWYHPDEPVPLLGPLSEAVWESQRIQIGYDRGDKTVDRVLEPLGLVLKAGVWYLVASADGQPRTYRVSRVARVTALDERIRAAGGVRSGRVLGGIERGVRARHAADRDRPADRRGAARPASAARSGSGRSRRSSRLDEPDPDGWVRARIQLDWPNEVVAQILAVGPDCELLEPAELRERIAAQARRVADHYAADPVATPIPDGTSVAATPAG